MDYSDYMIEPVDLNNLRPYKPYKDIIKEYDGKDIDDLAINKACIESAISEHLQEIKSQMIEGDQIVYLISPEWTWECLAGRAGYGIKRGEEIINPVCALMS